MTAVGRFYICLAAMIATSLATNLTVIDPMNQIDIGSRIHKKTDFCNMLKKDNINDFQLIYMVEGSNQENVTYFQDKLKNIQDKGADLHVKQYIINNSDIDDQSFLLCLKTIKIQQINIDVSTKAQIDEVLSNNTKNNTKTIVIFENAVNKFSFEARIMSTEEDKEEHADHENDGHDGNPKNEDGDEAKKSKVGAEGADNVQINISPEGVMGIGLGVAFILILVVYFGLLMQSADFNPKFIKEKLPQGKEY